eukprot:GHVN01013566.1.p1 GENE.GHVN01013566.1~~GHVN01013566.1.p1  ORF type:complete len:392 (-),score=72.41 GHVN01013566.1:2223-3296(-)
MVPDDAVNSPDSSEPPEHGLSHSSHADEMGVSNATYSVHSPHSRESPPSVASHSTHSVEITAPIGSHSLHSPQSVDLAPAPSQVPLSAESVVPEPSDCSPLRSDAGSDQAPATPPPSGDANGATSFPSQQVTPLTTDENETNSHPHPPRVDRLSLFGQREPSDIEARYARDSPHIDWDDPNSAVMQIYKWRYSHYFQSNPGYCQTVLTHRERLDKLDLCNLGLFSLKEMVDTFRDTLGWKGVPVKKQHSPLKALIDKAFAKPRDREERERDKGQDKMGHTNQAPRLEREFLRNWAEDDEEKKRGGGGRFLRDRDRGAYHRPERYYGSNHRVEPYSSSPDGFKRGRRVGPPTQRAWGD